jgi:DNA polymerase III epsilon subunit-like protein
MNDERKRRFFIFDTETSGLPRTPGFGKYHEIHDLDKYSTSRLVQIAWQVITADGAVVHEYDTLIAPRGQFRISENAVKIHAIPQTRAENEGLTLEQMLVILDTHLSEADVIVAHNLEFDLHILGSEISRAQAPRGLLNTLLSLPRVCTMVQTTDLCNLPSKYGGNKWPTLTELYSFLFYPDEFEDAHDALGDVKATSGCLLRLLQTDAIVVS